MATLGVQIKAEFDAKSWGLGAVLFFDAEDYEAGFWLRCGPASGGVVIKLPGEDPPRSADRFPEGDQDRRGRVASAGP